MDEQLKLLPGPFDLRYPAGEWRLAVKDPEITQHTWWIADIDTSAPPIREGDSRPFNEPWPDGWVPWEAARRGGHNIILKTIRLNPVEDVYTLIDPTPSRPSNIEYLLQVSPWPRLFGMSYTPNEPLTGPRMQIGVESADRTWRLILCNVEPAPNLGAGRLVLSNHQPPSRFILHLSDPEATHATRAR